MVLLCELRTALTTCSFELESLKHQYEALCPGKTLNIPASLVEDTKPAPVLLSSGVAWTTTPDMGGGGIDVVGSSPHPGVVPR